MEYGAGLQEAIERFDAMQPGAFNEWNIAASRIKAHLLYRPLLFLSRKGLRLV